MKDDLDKPVIFVNSNETWGDQWFIKHHYASELASMGFQVYFIDPVEKWKVKNILDQSITVKELDLNLQLVRYTNFLPVRILPKLILRINDWINARKLNKLREGKKLIVWQFDSFRFSYNFFGNYKKIYHVADHYHDLPFDQENIKNADLIVCTGKSLLPYYSGFGKPAIHIPHAISEDELKVNMDIVTRFSSQYGTFMLHAGSINDRLDLNIFLKLVAKFPDVNLVMIGSKKLTERKNIELFEICNSKPNFHYLGVINGKEIKNFVHASKLCLLAYDFNSSQTIGTVSSSLKVLNYLAQRRPIVSSIEIEYPELNGKVIFSAHTIDNYLTLVEEIISTDSTIDERSIEAFLKGNRYSIFIEQILNKLEHI